MHVSYFFCQPPNFVKNCVDGLDQPGTSGSGVEEVAGVGMAVTLAAAFLARNLSFLSVLNQIRAYQKLREVPEIWLNWWKITRRKTTGKKGMPQW